MKLKTHDGHEVDSQTHRLIIAFDVLEQFTVYTGPLFRRPVLEWNWKNGKRFPYVNLVFLGYEIQFGWVFDEIPGRPTLETLVGQDPDGNDLDGWCCPSAQDTEGQQHKMGCHVRRRRPIGGSPLPKPMPKRLVCGFIPPTPGYAPCTRDKGHSGPCAHDFIRRPGMYPKRAWF